MNNTTFRIHTGKPKKIDPQKTIIRRKPRLNLTMTQRFNSPHIGSKKSLNSSIDLPCVQRTRAGSIVSVHKQQESGYNPIAQVQAIPLTPQIVLKQFGAYLSKFEQTEILDYKEIHFLGMKAAKVKATSSDNNFGYDDERNDYKIVPNDHLAYRYEVQQVIGKGSFGQVCLCFDHKQKETVAVKVIRNQPRFHKQAKIEAKILSVLTESSSENYTVAMLNSFSFRKHICIAFELLGINLYEVLKNNSFRSLSLKFIRKIAYQLMVCLFHLKAQKIIHCDLKPENVLMSPLKKAGIKVIDFGSSCFLNEKIHAYIQSRYYRAPEIILGINYREAIDVWSVGCIVAELFLGFPIFPGENEMELLLCIMEVKGVPDSRIIEKSLKKKNFFEGVQPKVLTNSRGKKRVPGSRPLGLLMKNCDSDLIDFVDSKGYLECLEWDCEARITPEEALKHLWLKGEFNL